MSNIYYSYNDISIVPAVITRVEHRNQCNPFVGEGANSSLPIFTAPMSSIVNLQNVDIYKKNKIIPILPRNISLSLRLKYLDKGYWIALSLKETEELSLDKLKDNQEYKICIDIANGHMQKLYDLVHSIHISKPNIKIMTGNIANPETLLIANNAGVDYIRLGIGSGSGCITSSNTAIHYPMASLINDCYKYKKQWNLKIKLIADGGIRNYDDVIKALALGADYVMIGGLFAECKDTNPNYYIKSNGVYCKANKEDLQNPDIQLYHKFYGMASKQGMKDLHLNKHTAEGITRYIPIKYDSLHKWSSNMKDYLRSAMSYCNVKRLQDFIGTPKVTIISNNAKNAINK